MPSQATSRRENLWLRFSLGLAAASLAFGYQNCSEFVVDGKAFSKFASLGSSGNGGAALVPDTDKLDSACLGSSIYDACVMQQNPTLNSGKAIYGVKLTSLTGNGKLENATLTVRSINSPIVATTMAQLKSAPGVSGSSAFEQVNVYYWMTRATEYFDARSNGALPAKGKAIQVVVDDSITGYEAASNTIRLKLNASNGAVAWNGDIAIHLFGIANLMLANPAGWAALSTTKHATCSAVDKGCCASFNGCGNAIRFGVGEYFAVSMFPTRTSIGEGLVTTGKPQIIAGVQRDISSLTSSSANQIFSDSSGYAQSMGLLYAAIWWQVRVQAATESAEIDRIFLEHLTLINGDDDFKTALAKAKTVDARLFNRKHSAKFDAQLTAHGL